MKNVLIIIEQLLMGEIADNQFVKEIKSWLLKEHVKIVQLLKKKLMVEICV